MTETVVPSVEGRGSLAQEGVLYEDAGTVELEEVSVWKAQARGNERAR